MEQKIISSEITNRVVTEEQLLSIYNISLDDWEIEKKVVNTWEMGSKTPDGSIAVTPLFQIKIWLRSKKEIKALEQIRKEFIEDIKLLSPKIEKIDYKIDKLSSPKLLEINIFDLHLGKMAWYEETSNNYDLKIACSLFDECIDYFIENSKNYNIERIVLPIGNDFFNSDRSHPYNSTTAGTPQEEDTRWQKTFRTGRQLIVNNVNKLQQIAPVDIIMIPGNHDFERNFYLGDSLEGWFYNNPNINVDNTASPRKYYKYNNVLIGYTHGNEEKITSLPLVMAQEKPIEWSLTKFREFHLGHWHRKKEIKYIPIEEHEGVIIKFMSSLSAVDAWHNKKSYTTSKRSAEAMIWDSQKGLISNLYFNI
jgi:predicted phosphodiesterase